MGSFKLLRRILAFILAIVLFAAELFTLTLYTAGNSVEDAVLNEISENINIDKIKDTYAPKNSYTNFDVISTLKFLSKLAGINILDGIETTDDFVDALFKTKAMTNYFKEFSADLVNEYKNGNTEVQIDTEKLSAAVVDGITELFGVDIANNSTIKQFAVSMTQDYINNMVKNKNSGDMLKEFGVNENTLSILRLLTSEKARRISVAVCATIAVLILVLIGFKGGWLLAVGLPTVLAGFIFFALGMSPDHFSALAKETNLNYLTSLITAMAPLAKKFGGLVFASGIGACLLNGIFFSGHRKKE